MDFFCALLILVCEFSYFTSNHGKGTAKDMRRATELYVKACDGKIAVGCFNAGVHFEEGQGVAADQSYANQLFRIACNGGLKVACEQGNSAQRQTKNDGNPKDCDINYQQGCKPTWGFVSNNERAILKYTGKIFLVIPNTIIISSSKGGSVTKNMDGVEIISKNVNAELFITCTAPRSNGISNGLISMQIFGISNLIRDRFQPYGEKDATIKDGDIIFDQKTGEALEFKWERGKDNYIVFRTIPLSEYNTLYGPKYISEYIIAYNNFIKAISNKYQNILMPLNFNLTFIRKGGNKIVGIPFSMGLDFGAAKLEFSKMQKICGTNIMPEL